MKKKLSVIIVLSLFICVSVFFSACGDSGLKGGPNANADVSSNGGSVVRKGDYLYFMNGFISDSTLSGKDNDFGKEEWSAIYRVKLDINGNIVYNEDGVVTNVDLVVPFNVGVETSQLFIFGDRIYFSTPTTYKDSHGNKRFDYRDFYSIKLNGTDKKKLYATENWDKEKSQFNMVSKNGNVYLTVYDGKDLIEVEIKNGKKASAHKVASNVTSVAFDKVSTDKEINDVQSYVYYTRDYSKEENKENGNVFARFKIGEHKEEIVAKNNASTQYKVVEKTGENVIITKQGGELISENVYNHNVTTEREERLTYSAYTSVAPFYVGGDVRGIVATTENKLLFIRDASVESGTDVLATGVYTIQGFADNKVFVLDDSQNLYSFDLITKEKVQLAKTEDKLKTDTKITFDIEGRYVYMFKTFTGKNKDDVEESGEYLARVEFGREDGREFKQVGRLQESHTPVKEKEPEGENNADK